MKKKWKPKVGDALYYLWFCADGTPAKADEVTVQMVVIVSDAIGSLGFNAFRTKREAEAARRKIIEVLR